MARKQSVDPRTTITDGSNVLQVNNLKAAYGAVGALQQVSLSVRDGERIAIVGANGAGKSTLLNAIAGLLPETGGTIQEGSIAYYNTLIERMRADQIVHLGISLVPEGRHVFPRMTVEENLILGGYSLRNVPLRQKISEIYDSFPVLSDRRRQRAGLLSGGEQQMLAVGRALMSNPALLLVDEPSLGLSPAAIEVVCCNLLSINRSGTTLVIAEQNVSVAFAVAERAYLLTLGQIEESGNTADLVRASAFNSAFFGTAVQNAKG